MLNKIEWKSWLKPKGEVDESQVAKSHVIYIGPVYGLP